MPLLAILLVFIVVAIQCESLTEPQAIRMMRSLAIIVVWGLTVSTLLTLSAVPCAHLIVQTVAGAMARLVVGRKRGPAGSAATAEAGAAREQRRRERTNGRGRLVTWPRPPASDWSSHRGYRMTTIR